MNEITSKTPLFTLQETDETNVPQKVNVVSENQTGRTHKFFFYDEYNGSPMPDIMDWVATCVAVEGEALASISHPSCRVGQTFGYSRGGSVPEYVGLLKNCETTDMVKL